MDLFRDLHAEGATIVIITHDHELAATLPRQVHIRDGRIERDERSRAAVTR
jgi:putative ABC transport system ATP-binding protein